MSLARKRARNLKKQAGKGDRRARREFDQAKKTVRMNEVQRLRLENEYRKEIINNLWLIYRYVLHINFGFGKDRLLRLTEKTWREFEAIMAGNVKVTEIDQFLCSEIKFSCGLSVYDHKADRCKQIEDKAIRDLSAACLMALLDEFNFKSKRLEKFCHGAFEVNNLIEGGKLTYREMREKILKAMERGRKHE